MKKLIDWFKTSNRWKHVVGGLLIGLGSNGLYCAAYTGLWVAIAVELKDAQMGNRPDLIDGLITLAGVAVGYGLATIERMIV